MPPRKFVETLYNTTAKHVAKSIKNFIEIHPEECDTCYDDEIPEVICPYLEDARAELHITDVITQHLLNIITLGYNRHDDAYIKSLVLMFFLTDNCHLKTSCTLREQQDIQLIETYGKFMNLVQIRSSFIPNDELEYFDWGHLFTNLKNVQVISLRNIDVSDIALTEIGKWCHSLRQLDKVTFESEVTVESLKKFCFSDYPKNEVQNPCCKTLQVLNIDWDYIKNKHYEMMLDEGCLLLFRNLKRLKYIGAFPAEKLFHRIYSNKRKIFCLTSSHLELIDEIPQADVKTILSLHCLFPKLNVLSLIEPLSGAIEKIRFFQNLKGLCLTVAAEFDLNVFLKNKWYNLEDLTLIDTNANVDLSIVAYSCPNLESFYNKFAKSENAITNFMCGFQNLKFLWLSCKGVFVHYDVIPYVARSIENLYIYGSTSTLRSVDIYKHLIETPLPHLKHCVFEPTLDLPKETFRKLIYHCPALKTMGMVSDNQFELDVELDQENYDFTFEYEEDDSDFEEVEGNDPDEIVQEMANDLVQIFNQYPVLHQALQQLGQVPQENNNEDNGDYGNQENGDANQDNGDGNQDNGDGNQDNDDANQENGDYGNQENENSNGYDNQNNENVNPKLPDFTDDDLEKLLNAYEVEEHNNLDTSNEQVSTVDTNDADLNADVPAIADYIDLGNSDSFGNGSSSYGYYAEMNSDDEH